jgi:hypothetical protein
MVRVKEKLNAAVGATACQIGISMRFSIEIKSGLRKAKIAN